MDGWTDGYLIIQRPRIQNLGSFESKVIFKMLNNIFFYLMTKKKYCLMGCLENVAKHSEKN